MKLTTDARFATICIHAGQEPDPSTGAIITPIFQTSTYVQDALGQHKGFEYARTQNPTRSALEANLAAIEGGRAAFAFASGMAAISAITARLATGDHVVVTDNTYGGTFRLFDKVLTRYGLTFSFVDTSDLAATERAITPTTKLRLHRDADQSGPAAHGHRGRRNPRARRGRARGAWTTRSRARACSGRSSSAPISWCTARRNTSTATAIRLAASSSPRATRTSSGCGSCRTPRAPS